MIFTHQSRLGTNLEIEISPRPHLDLTRCQNCQDCDPIGTTRQCLASTCSIFEIMQLGLNNFGLEAAWKKWVQSAWCM